MTEELRGWQFQLASAPEPHPFSAVQVEAYCPELKKHAGIVLHEEHIESGDWKPMLLKLRAALVEATYAKH